MEEEVQHRWGVEPGEEYRRFTGWQVAPSAGNVPTEAGSQPAHGAGRARPRAQEPEHLRESEK